MQYKALTLVALAAGVSAQLPTDSIGASVVSVLATAIPQDSISFALANPASFSAELASSLSAGNTPEWYLALPSDVKSYLPKLYPAATAASTTAESTAAPGSTTPAPVATISGSPSPPRNSTVKTVSSATLGTTGGANSQSPSSSAHTGGAAYPTAVVGAGLAGAIGFLGMLAL